MSSINARSLTDNMVKALVFDVAITVGINLLTNSQLYAQKIFDVFAASFTGYTIRTIMRDDFGHPFIGGLIGGAVKYAVKDSPVVFGAFNNFAYEFFHDNPIL